MTVRRSFYLDEEVDEALRHSAKVAKRSVTKQLDFLLRAVLIGPMDTVGSFVYHDFGGAAHQTSFSGPDPKVKARPRLKAVDSSKKLT